MPPTPPVPAFIYAGTIDRVVDGDTLDVDLDLGCTVHVRVPLRLEHINAPEHGTPAGDAATAYLRGLLPVGRLVTVETRRTEKYGRRLAVVHLDDGDPATVNERIVSTGHAVPYEGGKR